MDLVRQLRMKKGWSQDQLAEAARVGKATIQRIEAGRQVPSPETAQSLAAVLDSDAQRIREHAGLAAQLTAVMRILPNSDPSARDLGRLPLSVRRVFDSFCAARRVLSEAVTTFEKTAQSLSAASVAMTEAIAVYDALFFATLGMPRTEEVRDELRGLQDRAKQANAQCATHLCAFRTASEQATRANADFTEAGLEVTRLLCKFM
jgi:transcriptional regulator with XRE-family HTH domain